LSQLRLWISTLSIAVAVALLPLQQSVSSEVSHQDFGGCVIETAISHQALGFDSIASQCSDQYDPAGTQLLNPWMSVTHCYDVYHELAANPQAALNVYRGCAWYFE